VEGLDVVNGTDSKGAATEFILHMEDTPGRLSHRRTVFLENLATSCVLDVDPGDDCLRARWSDFGEWQRLRIEKEATLTSHSATSCFDSSSTEPLSPSFKGRHGIWQHLQLEATPDNMKKRCQENCTPNTPEKRRRGNISFEWRRALA
jgi:hypothetical protein